MSAAEENLLFLLAKTLSRKEESKAVLCAFPALRDLFLFFHPPRRKSFFYISRKGAETQRGIESSPLRLGVFARVIFFFSSAAAKEFFLYLSQRSRDAKGNRKQSFAPFLLCAS